MNNFTKLYSSIITSTIWREDNATRILWITLLALSDSDGRVEGSIPGLAHIAGITTTECEASFTKLMSPDPYSRSKENEGRRVEEVDGGWLILNRKKYRDKSHDRTEYYRQYREQKKQTNATCAHSVRNTLQHKITQTKKETKKETKTNIPLKNDFDFCRKIYPGSKRCLDTEYKLFQNQRDWQEVLPLLKPAIEKQILTIWKDAEKKFIPHFKTWLSQRRWELELNAPEQITPTTKPIDLEAQRQLRELRGQA